MRKLVLLALASVLMTACQSEDDNTKTQAPIVRGLKTVIVAEQQSTTVRRFPGVLEPSEVTTMSFEISGKLGELDLKVGQLVKKGDLLAKLDQTSLDIQVDSSKAAVRQSQATADNAASNLERQQALFDKKVITRATFDDAKTSADTSAAALAQAKKQLETSVDSLGKAELRSTFDGIINTVVAESFSIISPGTPIVTMYQSDEFEVSFSVSYDIVQRLAVGKQVAIKLADSPDVVLRGIVSELGSKADTVSSFPIVVSLQETNPALKAGMAVEVALEFVVPTGNGFLLPLSVLPLFGNIDPDAGPDKPAQTAVFIFDTETSTVKIRPITIGGVRENQVIVIDGLNKGDRVASAGVSFLRDGMKVNLLPDSK